MNYPFNLIETIFVILPLLCVQVVIFLFIFKAIDRKWMGYCIPIVIYVSAYFLWKGGAFQGLALN